MSSIENIKFKVGEEVIYHDKSQKNFTICISEIQEIKIGNYGVLYIVDNCKFTEEDLYSFEKYRTVGISFLRDIMINKGK